MWGWQMVGGCDCWLNFDNLRETVEAGRLDACGLHLLGVVGMQPDSERNLVNKNILLWILSFLQIHKIARISFTISKGVACNSFTLKPRYCVDHWFSNNCLVDVIKISFFAIQLPLQQSSNLSQLLNSGLSFLHTISSLFFPLLILVISSSLTHHLFL